MQPPADDQQNLAQPLAAGTPSTPDEFAYPDADTTTPPPTPDPTDPSLAYPDPNEQPHPALPDPSLAYPDPNGQPHPALPDSSLAYPDPNGQPHPALPDPSLAYPDPNGQPHPTLPDPSLAYPDEPEAPPPVPVASYPYAAQAGDPYQSYQLPPPPPPPDPFQYPEPEDDDGKGGRGGCLLPLSRELILASVGLGALLLLCTALSFWIFNGGPQQIGLPGLPTAAPPIAGLPTATPTGNIVTLPTATPTTTPFVPDNEGTPGISTPTPLDAFETPTSTLPPIFPTDPIVPGPYPGPYPYPGPATPGGDPAPTPVGSPPAQVGSPLPFPTVPPFVPPTDTPFVPPTDTPFVTPTDTPFVPPTDTPFVPPTDTPLPTDLPFPTFPVDTPVVPPDEPTSPIGFPTLPPISTIPPLPTFAPLPTVPPTPDVDVIAGDRTWTLAESPIIIGRNTEIANGAVVAIEPGVEVLIAPDASIIVNGGQILSLGTPELPVRFAGRDRARWNGIYANEGSTLIFEATEISGGGATGTVLFSEEGELVIRNSRIFDNGGTVQVTDSRVEIRDTEISGNDLIYGGALNLDYFFGNVVTLINNRIAGNRQTNTTPGVQIRSNNTFLGLVLDIQNNLIRGGQVANLLVFTAGPIEGTISCNAFVGDNLGLSLRTNTPQVPTFNLRVENNFIEEHTPAIDPTFLDFGIGRGAASDIALDMRNNWWGDASGPYNAVSNPQGRGNAVGVNIEFDPWLRDPPPCAPQR